MANILDVLAPPERLWQALNYRPMQHLQREVREEGPDVDFVRLATKPALERLAVEVRACTACSIRQEAKAPVPGIGKNTGIVFIGRNPGKAEDLEGVPFTGERDIGTGGWALDKLLHWAGLTRRDVFLTNLVLCHTVGNREPQPAEIATCFKLHLMQYLRLLDPYLVVTLGAEPSKYLAGTKSISKDNGAIKWHSAGFWVIPTIQPAAICRDIRFVDQLQLSALQIRRFLAAKSEYLRVREERRSVNSAPVAER